MTRATVSQVHAWDPTVAATTSDALVAANQRFGTAMRQTSRFIDTALTDWRGDAAAAAALRALDSQLTANHLGAVLLDIADAFADAANLAEVRASVLAIEHAAAANGCAIAEDGIVTAPTADTGNPALDLALQACFDTEAATLQARLIPLLETAGEIDHTVGAQLAEASAALTALRANPQGAPLDSRVRAILDGTALLPDDPRAMRELWDSLAPADRDALFAYDPGIGNHDGLPAVARDCYNRLHLEQLRARARSDYADLQALHQDWSNHTDLPDTLSKWLRLNDWESAKTEIHTRLSEYDAMADQLGGDGAPRFLYAIDNEGRGVLALGNPDAARNIATFIPGASATLVGVGEGMDRAQALRDAAARADASARTAVVTWYGYHAPPDLVAARRDDYAAAAAPDLDRFQDGLRATHSGPPSHNTLVGHSYGSTVIGVAATGERSLAVDDVIFVGSPGVEADHVTELRLDAVPAADNPRHVFATAAAADPIPRFGQVAHGIEPTEHAFGATVFASSSGAALQPPLLPISPYEPWAHSVYWDRDNPGLATQGEIIAGTYPR